ncbi:hypothetical protein SK128_018356, partial [Halocaridina rubra]
AQKRRVDYDSHKNIKEHRRRIRRERNHADLYAYPIYINRTQSYQEDYHSHHSRNSNNHEE